MIIKTLVENRAILEDFRTEHGLSLYIETTNHKLLFDVGASGLFLENAKKLNVDIEEVDTVIISHGHYDHGGGLGAFLGVNTKAKIYVSQRAFDDIYANRPGGVTAYIGLDQDFIGSERFVLVGDSLRIDNELELFSNVKGRKFFPFGNQDLLIKRG